MLLGALGAFPVYMLLARHADPAFDSVLHRVAALTLLLLLPAYLACGGPWAHSRSSACRREASALETFGFGCSRRAFWQSFGRGFVLGIVVVTPLVVAFLTLGARAPVQLAGPMTHYVGALAAHLGSALVAATLIGLIEEAYFRGALLAPLRDLPAWLAVSVVSVVYAVVHFLGAPLPAGEPSWTSGLTSIAHSELPLDAFLALVAAGLFLGALRCRFGHIAVGAGFHAGWVWVMKLNQEYTDIVPGSEWAFVEGAFGGTMGYLGLAWITLLGAAWLGWERLTSKSGTVRSAVAHLR